MSALALRMALANDHASMPSSPPPRAAGRGAPDEAGPVGTTTGPDLPPRAAALWSTLHAELHRLAHGLLRRERLDHTLQTTALIHEAWIRLGTDESWGGRGRFLAAAARSMRCILVDHARARNRDKRNGGMAPASLEDFAIADAYGDVVDILALDRAARSRSLLRGCPRVGLADLRPCRLRSLGLAGRRAHRGG